MNEHTAAAVYTRCAGSTVWTLKAVLYNEERPAITTDADFLGQNICPGPFGSYAIVVSEAPSVRFCDIVDTTTLELGAVLLNEEGGYHKTERAEYVGRLS